MWPFKSKKKPVLRVISREYAGTVMEYDTLACDVDTFHKWIITYEDVETGKTFVEEKLSLG